MAILSQPLRPRRNRWPLDRDLSGVLVLAALGFPIAFKAATPVQVEQRAADLGKRQLFGERAGAELIRVEALDHLEQSELTFRAIVIAEAPIEALKIDVAREC